MAKRKKDEPNNRTGRVGSDEGDQVLPERRRRRHSQGCRRCTRDRDRLHVPTRSRGKGRGEAHQKDSTEAKESGRLDSATRRFQRPRLFLSWAPSARPYAHVGVRDDGRRRDGCQNEQHHLQQHGIDQAARVVHPADALLMKRGDRRLKLLSHDGKDLAATTGRDESRGAMDGCWSAGGQTCSLVRSPSRWTPPFRLLGWAARTDPLHVDSEALQHFDIQRSGLD